MTVVLPSITPGDCCKQRADRPRILLQLSGLSLTRGHLPKRTVRFTSRGSCSRDWDAHLLPRDPH
jgi:hypothetical protein